MRHRLDDPTDWARCAEKVSAYLAKHLKEQGDGITLVTCTITQVRNKLNYETSDCVRPTRSSSSRMPTGPYATRHRRRHGPPEIAASTDQVLRAQHRLHLAAKERRAAGDQRTLEQLKADLAIDLLTGRAMTCRCPPMPERSST